MPEKNKLCFSSPSCDKHRISLNHLYKKSPFFLFSLKTFPPISSVFLLTTSAITFFNVIYDTFTLKTHLPSFENVHEDLQCLIKANGEYRLYFMLFSSPQERVAYLVQFYMLYPADKPGNFNWNFYRKRSQKKKRMSKGAECMSEVLHSMNCSAFRKKMS